MNLIGIKSICKARVTGALWGKRVEPHVYNRVWSGTANRVKLSRVTTAYTLIQLKIITEIKQIKEYR